MKKTVLFISILLFVSATYAQNKSYTLKGQIVDSIATPIPNFKVALKHSPENSIITNKNGKFKLTVNAEDTLLIKKDNKNFFVAVNSNKKLLFVLTQVKKEKLPSIQLTAHDWSYKNKLITDTKTHNFEKETIQYNSIFDMIRARFPTAFNRGPVSVNSSNSILYIVDGSVMQDISLIPPSNVKSITVLNDSRAAKYGVRGAGGVIEITTK